ncbi:glycosyltransferase [Singulisphaera acidiphila]|uniref:Glycosyltransferase n=1 Tax=Singulisphaera acidiphila (strain ATCC BAA-1392 / DSM 18658 / VKM B-2454 / MOB10) TaxID=886293 RepID=L0DB18_SINAD|nr:glycosyltransferase [Singulisphaera acidiphila]AGA26574.1 glycosyltransferase [Singulisphaera acidiphila DSM 18658]
MRIGVDMLGVQSPHHGHRGIGRYGINLVSSLLARDDGHEFVFYVYESLSAERIPEAKGATVRIIGQTSESDGGTVTQRMDRLVRTNPDSLDLLLVLSPFEPWDNYCPPAPPLNGLKMAAVVYDLIPFLFPAENAYDPILMRYYRSLEALRGYDLLLAISDATRQDILTTLNIPEQRVVSIGAGCDRKFFVPDPSPALTGPSAAVLQGLGITKPYVLNVGGLVDRKNTRGLIDAFGRLDEKLKHQYQLVLTFSSGAWEIAEVREYAKEHGVEDFIWTNEVSDETLRILYQRCSAFVLPSFYEGFGLPLLEAMQCGAPVIAGNNSSQIEVVGDAGLLANVSDASDIAEKLERILANPELAQTLRDRASVQSQQFSWDLTAERAAKAVESLGRRRALPRIRIDRAHANRPRIAYFSPLPPRKSGISDYSVFLLNELKKTYKIDLFHDIGYRPDLALASDEFECIDARVFGLYAGTKDYHAIVYQMGNSRYHSYLYETMLRHPGVATLHDFCLAGFHLHYGHSRGMEREYIRNELLHWYPEHEDEIRSVLKSVDWDWEVVARECAKRGWYLNRRMFDTPNLVVVHSPWCLAQVEATRPEHAERTMVIPHGIWPRLPSESEKAAIRTRFDLPQDALIVASFGFIHPDKMNPEALDAFQAVARANEKAMFLFVGEDADGGIARRQAAALGLLDRVRFLGRQPWSNFTDLIAVTDLGVNLRLPPTNGETSGALLNMLAAGVPTIVTDVATFSDYPAEVVRKVRWETEGIDGLRRALFDLASNQVERKRLGEAAWKHCLEHHEWPRVAAQYVEAIERSHRQLASAGKTFREARLRRSGRAIIA